ncbi:hypothetical protein ASE14_16575 [Agromyces sp. Root81]|uniref:hypothetical protein n=1 Tax=Agromyces sp. Root81 TaxID=1736601 RepID=UPI0006FD73DC|nr:hypothetical protein [Agromyces sp. Root81]KRC59351.1 hypothetical protein ASE14_16575 [Agromyces sp. Root81]
MTATRPIAAASLALFALLLTGCAGASNAGDSAEAKPEAKAEVAADQTPQEACDLMKGSLEELVELSSAENVATLTSDPTTAVAALKTTEASMREAAAKVTNADVVDAANGASGAMTEYTAFLDVVVSDPANADLSKLSEQVTALQTGIAELGEVCSL